MKKIFIVILLTLIISSVPAIILTKEKDNDYKETFTVTGTIQCSDEAPISRAYVYLVGHSYVAISDDGGNFAIHAVLPGEYLLEVKSEDRILFSEIEFFEDPPAMDLGILYLNCGECATEIDGTPCDDGDACTENDTCIAGVCVEGTLLDCDDGNMCTDEFCDSSLGCVVENNNDPCNDENACTDGDMCSGGECVGGPEVICDDDGNICTLNFCDPNFGCVWVPGGNGGDCYDGDPCTDGDICLDGVCVGGPPVDCDDGNVCTDDSCNPAIYGCVHVNNNDPCDDGNDCTNDDVCSSGVCAGILNTELCNGFDDDCDGQTDEDFLGLDTACDGADSDECMNGTYTCTADGLDIECVNETSTDIPETCSNGVDDDCDGQTDEGCD